MTTATTATTAAYIAAARFHALAKTASRNGGLWVSMAGGTANVVAGAIADATGASFGTALRALDSTGGEDWYEDLARSQPWPFWEIPEGGGRWDARTIAKAACRGVARLIDRSA